MRSAYSSLPFLQLRSPEVEKTESGPRCREGATAEAAPAPPQQHSGRHLDHYAGGGGERSEWGALHLDSH